MHFSSFVQTRLNESPPPPPPSPPPPITRARLACRGGWREAHGGKKSMWGKRRLLFECNHIRLCERIYNNKKNNNNRKAVFALRTTRASQRPRETLTCGEKARGAVRGPDAQRSTEDQGQQQQAPFTNTYSSIPFYRLHLQSMDFMLC